MDDQRRADRLRSWLHATYRVPSEGDKIYNSVTRNASEGGMGLLTEREFEPGTALRIEVRCANHRPITCTAEVRWSKPLVLAGQDEGPRAFETGVRFSEITPEDRKSILLYTVLRPPPAVT